MTTEAITAWQTQRLFFKGMTLEQAEELDADLMDEIPTKEVLTIDILEMEDGVTTHDLGTEDVGFDGPGVLLCVTQKATYTATDFDIKEFDGFGGFTLRGEEIEPDFIDAKSSELLEV